MTLSEWLLSKEIRPSAFARRLGVSHTTVSRWLDGSTPPSPASMNAVFRETGGAVTANDLLRQCDRASV